MRSKTKLAYRIFTVPLCKGTRHRGTEHCSFDENTCVSFSNQQGANYRPLGENVAKGEVVFEKAPLWALLK